MYFVACQSHTCAKELKTQGYTRNIFFLLRKCSVINILDLVYVLAASIIDKWDYYRIIQRKI